MTGQTEPSSWAPWTTLVSPAPFKLRGLGLLLLVFGERLDATIGRLVASRYLEYLPISRSYAIALGRHRRHDVGYVLYNITSGDKRAGHAGWFTSWLRAQELAKSRCVIQWTIEEKPRNIWQHQLTSILIAVFFMGLLLCMTILSADWYGFASVAATVLSVVVRTAILGADRRAFDLAVLRAHAYGEENAECFSQPTNEPTKCIMLDKQGNMVTMHIPMSLVDSVFLDDPKPRTKNLSHAIRLAGVAAFVVQALALGMAGYVAQLCTIALLAVTTMLMASRFGCDDSKLMIWWKRRRHGDSALTSPAYTVWVGRHLKAAVREWPVTYEFVKRRDGLLARYISDVDTPVSVRSSKRQDLYAWLQLNPDEEESMDKWDLFPHIRNGNMAWWEQYRIRKGLIAGYSPENAQRGASNPRST